MSIWPWNTNTELRQQLNAQHRKVAELLSTIRSIDETIYIVSQCTNYEAMRPHIAKLIAGAQARRKAESDRINNLIDKELRS